MNLLDKIIIDFDDEKFIKIDGFDNALLGVDLISMNLIYSVSKCLEILNKKMNEEEALDYFYFNIIGNYAGEGTPLFCYDNF